MRKSSQNTTKALLELELLITFCNEGNVSLGLGKVLEVIKLAIEHDKTTNSYAKLVNLLANFSVKFHEKIKKGESFDLPKD